MTDLRGFAICLIAICSFATLAWLMTAIPFFVATREHDRYVDTVFMPFAELRADFLSNGFGVYILEFRPHSDLSDDNVDQLLLLNDLPRKYDLTVLIETEMVTDASVDTLAQLSCVDSLFVDKSGMTPEGVGKLKSLLPTNTVSHYTWENPDHE
ncbi:hypothetical protein [Candidatus Laterigemmans baculatus]|uniref:hypothetical protein n=1 Tax=Candidatus Laterigemmans baculatus TaxID=2770505 RepID=UPI0013DB5464|nr:hypothetical protein [Candidatus Laterigemmans baculatus]